MTPLDLVKAADVAEVARKLQGMRDTVRGFLGDGYNARIEPIRARIRDVPDEPGARIRFAMEAGKAASAAGDGVSVLYIMAAVCDVLEGL